jgi:hypothetical protein
MSCRLKYTCSFNSCKTKYFLDCNNNENNVNWRHTTKVNENMIEHCNQKIKANLFAQSANPHFIDHWGIDAKKWETKKLQIHFMVYDIHGKKVHGLKTHLV